MQINYVPKEQLYPSFGQCLIYLDGSVVINIREDLPQKVKDFVLEHEIYHSADKKAIFWAWREVKANIAAFAKEPIGGIITVVMSLAPSRLKFYWERVKKKA